MSTLTYTEVMTSATRTVTSPSLPCRYCGEPVFEQYDGDTGETYFPYSIDGRTGAHLFGCMTETSSGGWVVRLGRPGRVSEKRYTTRKRAREVAREYREWNPGAKDLDITVVHDPV